MNKVIFTIYKSPEPLSKRYWIDNGGIQKQAAAQMTKGTAERVSMPFANFTQALAKATDKQAFGYGQHSFDYPDKVSIVVSGKEQPEKNIISRTQKFYAYPEGPGLAMVDHDPNEYVPVMSDEQLIKALIDIHPDIGQAARIVRGSVSAGVHKVGEQPRTDKGFHIYFPVANAADIPRYGKLLFDRLWLDDFGFIALASNGALLVRTVIDGAVFSPERLDFVGKPIISGSGLEYTSPETTYIEGGLLDTESLTDLTDEEQATVERLKAKAKNAIKPAAADKQNQWAEDKIETMQAAGVPVEKAREVINRILKGGSQDLYDDFILEFTTGKVSVADVLKRPQAFDGKALADPIEGPAYGTTTAKFYANQGDKPVIHSLAHGQDTSYFLHLTPPAQPINSLAQPTDAQKKPDWQVELDTHVERFNKTHASVVIGGKHRIMRSIKGDATPDGREAYEFFSRNDLSLVHDNTSIKTGEKEVHGKPKDIYANHLMAWAKNHKSRSYTGGVIFLPGRVAPANYFNTWRGFSVKPKKNDALLKLIYDHMKDVVCAGHQDLYDYFLKWTAYTIQNPDKPAGAALVLRGEKGCGKGTIGHFLRVIWDNHGLHITNPKHLVGNFNGHLNDVCFLFADEAFFSGDHTAEGILKGLITEPSIMIERKGIDAISQPNYLKVLMATNSDWAVPATKDERRYCVMDVSSSRISDLDYFDSLRAACHSKEVQAAFLYAMLNVDLTGFHTGDIPDSVGLRKQRYNSMKPHQKWLADSLINGTFNVCGASGSGNNWYAELSSVELFRKYVEWCDTAKTGEYRRVTQCMLGGYLGKVFTKLRIGNDQLRGYQFGSLEDAKKRFEEYEKVSLAELTK